MIAAITISCIGAACLLLIAILWVNISLCMNPDFTVLPKAVTFLNDLNNP